MPTQLSRVVVLVCLVAILFVNPLDSNANEPAAPKNLLVNGNFEDGLDGWDQPWARDGEITAKSVSSEKHDGEKSVQVESGGEQDWSFPSKKHLEVKPGEIFRLTGWIRVQGTGSVTPSVTLYDSNHQPTSWVYGGITLKAKDGWQRFETRFGIPRNSKWIWPRIVGNGSVTVGIDNVSLTRDGNISMTKEVPTADPLAIENDLVRLELSSKDGTCILRDKRTGKTWRQKADSSMTVIAASKTADCIETRFINPETLLEFSAKWSLPSGVPEACVEIEGTGVLNGELRYPCPFVSDKSRDNDWLIMPVNEGIAYPVDDETIPSMWYNAFGGHGLCMGWYGVAGGTNDRNDGLMTIIETPNDAAVYTPRTDGRLCLAPIWLPEKGKFGPKRKLRYVLFDKGGYVAMSKRYRAYAKKIGLFKTLAKKRKENPDVDLLIGAVNVWCWDSDAVAKCKEMQALGMDRILWSSRKKPEEIQQMNALGVLTSRYDIYQDCMNPVHFPKLSYVADSWTSEAWPDGIILDEDGDWSRGWRVKSKDGKEFYPCGRLCDLLAPEFARHRVAKDLETHPYRCRFIDTTTASPWTECYSPDHPMTRTESRQARMELLDIMSREFKLVTGSETGHDAAVPYVHYFEGMLSLGPYRVPDSGREMLKTWHDVPPRVAKFQTGHKYRIPLWELVYHDCVVAQWYWGDYNNKLPSLWDRRDLFNLLYNTPPMFMFNKPIWEKNKDRFVQSYKTTHALPHETGYAEMLSHRWLTDDHAVQQTQFSNGMRVTVNFGDTVYKTAEGKRVEPLGYVVEKDF